MKLFITAISVYCTAIIAMGMTILNYFERVESGQLESLDTVQDWMLIFRVAVIAGGAAVLMITDWCCVRNRITLGLTLIPVPVIAASIITDQWWFAWKWHVLYRQINPGNDDLFFGGFLTLFWLFIIFLASVVNVWFLMTIRKYQTIRSVKIK